MTPFALILPAAGLSARFGGPRSKLLEPLCGVPVIAHCLRTFLAQPGLAEIAIPTRAGAADADDPLITDPAIAPLLSDPRVKRCVGGATRAHSVWNGLKALNSDVEWVAVHDAARPLITAALIDATLRAAIEHGAAVPALPVALTIKQADGPLPAKVQRTVPRASLWAMQTPQIMRRADLLKAFETCPIPLDQVTDDVQLIELAGGNVWLVNGEERNLKITTALDLKVATLLMSM